MGSRDSGKSKWHEQRLECLTSKKEAHCNHDCDYHDHDHHSHNRDYHNKNHDYHDYNAKHHKQGFENLAWKNEAHDNIINMLMIMTIISINQRDKTCSHTPLCPSPKQGHGYSYEVMKLLIIITLIMTIMIIMIIVMNMMIMIINMRMIFSEPMVPCSGQI